MFPSFLRFVVYCHFLSSTKQIATPNFVSIIVDWFLKRARPQTRTHPWHQPGPGPGPRRGGNAGPLSSLHVRRGASSLGLLEARGDSPSVGFTPGLRYPCAEKEPNIPCVHFFLGHYDLASPSADCRHLRASSVPHAAPAGATCSLSTLRQRALCSKPQCGWRLGAAQESPAVGAIGSGTTPHTPHPDRKCLLLPLTRQTAEYK